MAGSEIITLQVGHYANFVGTHWWNMQEGSFVRNQPGFEKEINHDRLFHTGLTARGEETYTPRMVFVDLKGSLRHLRRDGTLYETTDTNTEQVAQTWDGGVEQQNTDAPPKNQFLSDLDEADAAYLQRQGGAAAPGPSTASGSTEADKQRASIPVADRKYDLDDQVEVWSDYLRPHLHPRSCCELNGYSHSGDCNPFDIYSLGLDAMGDVHISDHIGDQIRYFAEACDRLQGCQLLTDVHNGFGGISTEIVQHLQDEYEKKAIFTVATMPSYFEDNTTQKMHCRALSTAFSLQELAENSSMLLPLSAGAGGLWPRTGAQPAQLEHVSYKNELSYHTSALLAATLDTITLPYRLRAGNSSIHQIADLLTPLGRKVTSAYAALPFPYTAGQKLVDCLTKTPALHDSSLSMCLTPLTHDDDLAYAQCATLRGIPPVLARQTDPDDLKPDDAFRTYLGATPSATINSSCYVHEAGVVAAPFPNLFQPSVTVRGFMETEEAFLRPSGYVVQTMPMLAALQSRNSSSRLVEQIVASAVEAQPRRQFAFYQSTSLSADSWSNAKESLLQLADNYCCD